MSTSNITVEDDKCPKCFKLVKNGQRGICCDICNKWYHLKCSLLKLSHFKSLEQSNESWFCRSCLGTSLPFNELTNAQLRDCFPENKCEKRDMLKLTFDKTCSVCSRKVQRPNVAKKCRFCKSYIHVKCSGKKILENDWMCPACTHLTFPFMRLNNLDLTELNNPNIAPNEKCNNLRYQQLPVDFQDFLRSRRVLGLKYNDPFETNCDNDDDLHLQYYEISDFHKITKDIVINNNTKCTPY